MNEVSFGPLFIWAILRKLRSGFHSFEWMRCLALCEKVTSHRDWITEVEIFGMTSRVWSPVGLGGWSWFSVADDRVGGDHLSCLCLLYVLLVQTLVKWNSQAFFRQLFYSFFGHSVAHSSSSSLQLLWPMLKSVSSIVISVVLCQWKTNPSQKMSS